MSSGSPPTANCGSVKPAVVAVVVENAHFIGHSAAQEPPVDHHALVAGGRDGGRDQGAVGEVHVAETNQLFAPERHFEAPDRDFGLAEGPPADEHIAPSAAKQALVILEVVDFDFAVGPAAVQVVLELELEVVADLGVDAAADLPAFEGGFANLGIEGPPVELRLEADVQPEFAELEGRPVAPAKPIAFRVVLLGGGWLVGLACRRMSGRQ